MSDSPPSGGYRFVQCEECKKKLPVGVSWDTTIKCGNCGNVQTVGSGVESARAAERREERCPGHEVLGYIERDHSMNGRPCENPWAVIRIRHTGNITFYCGECGVQHHGGAGYDDLMDRWGGEQDTNPDARGYPGWDHISAVTRGVYLRGDRVYHVPPGRAGGESIDVGGGPR